MKKLILVGMAVLTICGCMSHKYKRDPEYFDDKVSSELEAIPLYTDGEEYSAMIKLCLEKDVKELGSCSKEMEDKSMAQINLLYPFSDQTYAENYFRANQGTVVSEYVASILAEAKSNKAKKNIFTIKTILSSDGKIKFYEKIARACHQIKKSSSLYARHSSLVDQYNNEADEYNRRISGALGDASNQMQTNSINNRLKSIENRQNQHSGINSN